MNADQVIENLFMYDVFRCTVLQVSAFLCIAREISLGHSPTIRNIGELLDVDEKSLNRSLWKLSYNKSKHKNCLGWIDIRFQVESARCYGCVFEITDRGREIARKFEIKV